VLDAAAEALVNVASLQYFGWIVLGTFVGLMVGVIPGLGGVTGMSLLLPFIYGMDPYSGLALLMGMAAVTHTSDTFPSVLIGLPGSAGSQATILDGYAMARKGEAERALGAAFTVSLAGGVIGALVLLATITAIRPIVLSLGSPELFMFALLGLAMVGLLTGGQPFAGLAVGAIGLLLGAVGAAPATAEYRFTYEILYLYDGFPIALVALGLFAIPEMIDLLIDDRPIAKSMELRGGRLRGIRDAWTHKFLVLRSAVFGNVIGVIPGLGGAVVDWMAYGFAKQTAKDDSQFGKGDVRGVIAPESANNAKEAGTLVPTLVFGIPGSPTTAVLLGGLLLLGLRPGPEMVASQLPVTLSVIWTLVVANALGALACFGLTKQIARVTTVPPKILVPCLLVVITIAAYQSSFHWGDIAVMLGIGVLGWWWKQVGWARAPFIIGFVLSTPAERYLHLSMSRYGLEWTGRPIVMVIASMIVLGIVVEAVRQTRRRNRVRAAAEAEGRSAAAKGRSAAAEGADHERA
jgi:putative tricarboxylic transport membrane protein